MYVQKFLTPVVLVSLVIAQGNPAAFAQQPAAQAAQQPSDQPTQNPAIPPAQQPVQQSLSNDAVIRFVKAGLSDDLIVSTVASSPGSYDVSPDGVIALKGAGVSDRVVAAIVQKSNTAALPAPAPAPPPTPVAAPAKYLLADGSDVYLAFDEDLSSKTANEGDTVTFVLTEDLKVGDVVVAKAGAKAVGEVTNAQKAGMLGKGGELNIRLDYLKVGTARVHLRGTKGGEGKSGTGGAIALSLLVSPLFLLLHGKQMKVTKGTALHAYVADDISLLPAI